MVTSVAARIAELREEVESLRRLLCRQYLTPKEVRGRYGWSRSTFYRKKAILPPAPSFPGGLWPLDRLLEAERDGDPDGHAVRVKGENPSESRRKSLKIKRRPVKTPCKCPSVRPLRVPPDLPQASGQNPGFVRAKPVFRDERTQGKPIDALRVRAHVRHGPQRLPFIQSEAHKLGRRAHD